MSHGSTVSNLLPRQEVGKFYLFSIEWIGSRMASVDLVPLPLAHSVSRAVRGTARTSLRVHGSDQSG